MKPLTLPQTIAAFAFFLTALLFAGYQAVEDEQVNAEYVASIIMDSREQALIEDRKADWHHLVNWGDEYVPQTVAMGEVK